MLCGLEGLLGPKARGGRLLWLSDLGSGRSFRGCLLDTVSGGLCGRILRRQQIQVLSGNAQLSMRSNNIGVFTVFLVQCIELPTG